MQLVERVDLLIEQKSLLKHPFYQKWSEGSLSVESLAGYSKEYYHLVKAVPEFVGAIVSNAPQGIDLDSIKEVHAEEIEHIPLWIKFASSLGVDAEGATVKAKTIQAVSDMKNLMSDFESGMCAMYAFEKEIPKISRTKLEGLAEFYSITSDDATEYFRVHTEADIRHAAVWRRMIEGSKNPEAVMATAGASLDAQNLLLDACYEAYC